MRRRVREEKGKGVRKNGGARRGMKGEREGRE